MTKYLPTCVIVASVAIMAFGLGTLHTLPDPQAEKPVAAFGTTPHLEPSQRPAHVVRVIDGDTIITEIIIGSEAELGYDLAIKTSARLYGINAPDNGKEGPERTRAATEHLKELLAKHAPVGNFFAQLRGRDKYGRILIDILADSLDINQQMILDGHAVVYLP